MKTIDVSELHARLDGVIEDAQSQPIMVQGATGGPIVILSATEYALLQQVEDAYWVMCADQAMASGQLNAEETRIYLDSRSVDWLEE